MCPLVAWPNTTFSSVTVADGFGGGLLLVVLPAQDHARGVRPVRGNLDGLAAQFLALAREEVNGESQVPGQALPWLSDKSPPRKTAFSQRKPLP